MRLFPVVAAVSAAVLLAAGSSSSSGSGSPASSRAGSSSSSSSPAASASAPSKSTLTGEMVTAADLGSGWAGAASSDDTSDNSKTDAELASCLGVSTVDPKSAVDVNSDDFTKGNVTVSTSGSSYSSTDDVTREKSLFANPKIESCLTSVLKKALATSLPAGGTLGDVQVQVQPGPVSGYPSNVIALSSARITATAEGKAIAVYLDSAYIVGTLTTVELDFEGDNEPPADDLETSVLKAVAARVTA